MIGNTVLLPRKDKQLKCQNSRDIRWEKTSLLKMHCILQFPFHAVFPKCYIWQQTNDNNISQNASGRWSFKYTWYFWRVNKTGMVHHEHKATQNYHTKIILLAIMETFSPLFSFFFFYNHPGFECQLFPLNSYVSINRHAIVHCNNISNINAHFDYQSGHLLANF